MRVYAAVVALCLVASPALAQEAEAERLFNEATALVANKKYSEACPKFEASQRLDPALGTQFNLADCYENIGRPATAWALFRDVQRLARQAGKGEREKLARERAAELEPKLARVHLDVSDPNANLQLKRDGVVVEKEDWPKATPIDPGSHVIEASAPAFETWKTTITITDAPTTQEVHVPKLRKVEAAPEKPTADNGLGSQRVLALGIGGLGIVGVGIGSVFGVIAISRHDDAAASACPAGGACTDKAAVDAWDSARSAGNISTLAFAAGGALLVAGAVIWLTAPSGSTRVGIATNGTNFGLRGAW